ncbi:pyrroline-5-carboxylate reductase 1, mitochondrial-like [Physella acuta]|uniref:pyrroline-5-carboxylate reductase 1, mitochondrial-like n=1 Tax=Physella acuta TaxID=109671 RepID=UPI0027DDF10D|nr:pyrroline-5-carboxylate reductase 1, mitochondrial-like [Physella acuta]
MDASTNTKSQKEVTKMVGFIGGGRMAQAMAKGFISSGLVRAKNILVSDNSQQMLSMVGEIGVNTTMSNKEVVENSELIVIAVKPNIVAPILKEVAGVVSPDKHLFVSIAAGVTIRSIEQNLPAGTRVVRVMPNTPALVQAGAAVMASGSSALPDDVILVQELLRTIGICEESPEYLLDAVTGVSGSGPAYAFAAIESLSDGGVKMGLPRELATKLAAQTLLGAAKMVLETGKHPGQLKDEVCSPAGTTIAAMHVLEKKGFRGILMDAVEAATLRAKELGASN